MMLVLGSWLLSHLLALAEADAQRRARRAMANILGLKWKESRKSRLSLFPLDFILARHP